MVVKSRITELLENVEATDNFLGTAVGTVERRLATAVGASERRIVNLMQQLETNTSGRLEGVKINLKQAQRNHKDLLKIMEQEYGIAVDEVIGEFSQISRFIERSWKDLGESAAYTAIDKDMIATLEASTWDQFKAFGDDATNQIADAMYAQVVSGGRFSDLMVAVEGVLTGHVDARGRPMTAYTKQFSNDAVMNFHNEVNLKKGEDLGMNEFLYVGDIISTTRQFCQVRAMKTYTRNQIDSWTHDWKGKSGPAYEYRGGYNCRHHWRPIRKEWLDDEFGETTDDELLARSHANEFPVLKNDVNEVDELKRQHDASQAKSKKLKAERDALKKQTAISAADKARIGAINAELKPLKDERRILKQQIKELKGGLGKQGRKIKKDVAGGKAIKPLTKKQLADAPIEASDVGLRNFQERGIKGYDNFYRDFEQPIVKETARILEQSHGALADAAIDRPVREVMGFRQKWIPDNWGGEPGNNGLYSSIDERIKVSGVKFRGRFADPVTLGRFNSGQSAMHVYRHEYGHHIHLNVLRTMDGRWKSRWFDLYQELGTDLFESQVSLYSTTNVRESFAESFAAYVNPNYKKGMLPTKIEKYFKDLFELE